MKQTAHVFLLPLTREAHDALRRFRVGFAEAEAHPAEGGAPSAAAGAARARARLHRLRAVPARVSFQNHVERSSVTEKEQRNHLGLRGGILFWREMLLNMMNVFDTISFVRAFGTKGETKGDMTKTVNKHVKCHQHFSPEKDPPSYTIHSHHTV